MFTEAKLRNILILSYKKLNFLQLKEFIKFSKELSNYDIIHIRASKYLRALVPGLKIRRLKTLPLLTKGVGSYM